MHSKMFQISDGLDNALGAFAQSTGQAASAVIREAIAEFIGYDLENEPKDPRSGKKYANEEERRKANNARQKERNRIKQELVAAYRRGDREEDIAKLVASLAAVGQEDNSGS